MAADPARPQATYQDVLDTPQHQVAEIWTATCTRTPGTCRTPHGDGVRKSYAREKVSHLWLVEPRARTLEVYRLDGDGYRSITTHGENEAVRIEPFDAIELDISALWPSPRPADD